jgi:hypothetical protein
LAARWRKGVVFFRCHRFVPCAQSNHADDAYRDSIMATEPGVFLLVGLGLPALLRRKK